MTESLAWGDWTDMPRDTGHQARLLLLQGDMGIGKTRLIQGAIGPLKGRVGGFFTRRVVGGAGFALHIIGGEPGDGAPGLFIYRRGETWLFDGPLFEKLANPLLERLHRNPPPLVVLDELGGAEFGCQDFMALLYRLLGSGVACLGVYKQDSNSRIQRAAMPGMDDIPARRMEFEGWMHAHGGALYTLTEGNRDQVIAAVGDFARSAVQQASAGTGEDLG